MKKPLISIIIALLIVGLVTPLVILQQKKPSNRHQGIVGIRVLMPDGSIKVMQLEDYLVGVVAAEMPASFQTAALEAQVVAARTFAVRRMIESGTHNQGYDVDTTQRTQVWISDQQMRQKWGVLKYIPNKMKIENAVKDTKGLALVYKGSYVQAFYFADAGRLPTENAQDVWGTNLPYLTNVKPEPDEIKKFIVQTAFSAIELDQKLGTNLSKQARLVANDVRVTERTTAGRAKTVWIDNKVISASLFRTELGLKSTDFTWEVKNNELVFTTYGSGHAVGMSQYGANDLAKEGKNVSQILEHYYPGSNLVNIGK